MLCILVFVAVLTLGGVSGLSLPKSNMIMPKHGKNLPGSNLKASAVSAVVSVGVVLPLWLTTLVPMALLEFVASGVKSVLGPRQKRLSDYWETGITARPADALDSSAPRELDLVIYGATGFTGELLTKYVAENYRGKVKFAIGGRSKEGLERVRASLGDGFADVPIIVAESSDAAAITSMVRRTKAIANLAGPFSVYANLLVATCAQQGTHYADITGEANWVSVIIDKYDKIAQESGARIVNMCGCDCVPWEMSVHAVHEEFKKRGYGEIREVNCYDHFKGSASGGTLTTISTILADKSSFKPRCGFNPLVMLPDGTKSAATYTGRPQYLLGYSTEISAWTGCFIMSTVMAQSIMRSNALNKYSKDLTYREAMVFPNFFAALSASIGLVAGGTAFYISPIRSLLLKFGLLPKPGEGPSSEAMDESFLEVKTVAHGVKKDGKSPVQVTQSLYFPTDPGYRDTARMLAETALTMILDEKDTRVNTKGGVLTPSAACGSALLDRLVQTGCEYAVEADEE